jgi:hypothetical protein
MTPDSGLGNDDEVVAVVADEDAARSVVEALLLAGLGPGTRPGRDGLEVTVVAGQGERAREVLGAPEPETSPFVPSVPPTSEAPTRGPEWSSSPAGTAARAARRRDDAPEEEGATGPRFGMVRVLVLFGIALILIPAIAFYISYRVAGG